MKTIAKVITVMAVVTAVFAGSQRTSNLRGAQCWADDWATLRVGYSKGYDLMGLAGTVGAFTSGVGMTWGQWGLDVTINDLTAITGNPLHYATDRNTNAVFSRLDLSCRW